MRSCTDPGWMEELLAQAGWVRRIAGELVAGDLADDVSQDVWVKSLGRPPQDRTAPRAWLKTVVWNMVRSGFRSDRRRREREWLVEQGAPPPDSPEELAARMELQSFLAEQILNLGEPYRQTVLLRYLEGLSAADIARSLRLPAGTIRRRLKVGLDQLRQALDQRHGGLRDRWLRVLVPLAPSAGAPGGGDAPSDVARAPSAPTAASGGRLLRWSAGIAVAVTLTSVGVLWRLRQRPSSDLPRPAARLVPDVDPRRVLPFKTTSGEAAEPAALDRGVIAGTVRTSDGQAVDGAVVTLTSLAQSRPHTTATTSGGGRFELAKLPAGDFGLTASAEGGWASRAPVAVRAGGLARVDLILSPGAATLEGRVLDAGGGGGVSRATVTAWSDNYQWTMDRVFEAHADDGGHYRLALPPGRYSVRARGAGYARAFAWLDLPGSRSLDLRLHPNARLTGRVLERPAGLPVAEATVTAVDEEGHRRTATTDASGTFALEIGIGQHHVSARKGLLFGAGTPVEARPAESAETEVILHRVPAIAGRVLDSHGKGAAGVSVSARAAERTSSCPPIYSSTSSGVDGHFRFEGLPECALELTAEAPAAPSVAARLAAAAGGEERRTELRLVAGAVLRGVVAGSGGARAAGARVSARVAAPAPAGNGPDEKPRVSFHNVITDGDGRFEMRGLAAGDVWLAAEATDGGVGTSAVPRLGAGETREIALTLDPPSRLSGTMRYPDGRLARSVLIEAVTLREGVVFGFSASALSDDEGRFTLAPLAAGAVSLRPGGSWYGRLSGSNPNFVGPKAVTMGAGEHLKGVAFVVPRMAGEIAGAVTDRHGGPIAGAIVDMYLEDAEGHAVDFERRTFSDEAGAFDFADVPEGTHQIRASHPTLGRARVPRVAPGASRVVLQL